MENEKYFTKQDRQIEKLEEKNEKLNAKNEALISTNDGLTVLFEGEKKKNEKLKIELDNTIEKYNDLHEKYKKVLRYKELFELKKSSEKVEEDNLIEIPSTKKSRTVLEIIRGEKRQ